MTTYRTTNRFVTIMLWLMSFHCVSLLVTECQAQSLWQVTPYRVLVWVAVEEHPEVPLDQVDTLSAEIAMLCESIYGVVWKTEVKPVPKSFEYDALTLATPQPFALATEHPELETNDKLFVVRVRVVADGFQTTVRELDLATRHWSEQKSATCVRWSDLVDETVRVMSDIFLPLTEITRVEETTVTAEVRAGALRFPESYSRAWRNPTVVEEGDLLIPYIRKRDRDGKVKEKGVSEVKYTVLLVRNEDFGTLTCETFSGYRQPFKTRRSSRTQQLALMGRIEDRRTVLHLFNRNNEKVDLVGYEVYARVPGEKSSTFVGRTNWKGELEIPPGPSPIRMLFVKSGSRVLAKLPVVPGMHGRIDVGLRDDESRLEAEGFLLGIQESLVDLVSRREILSIRIRKLIEKKRFDEAEELITELSRLPTREDFENLVQQRKRMLNTTDPRVQDQIDKLFIDTRELFSQYLDPRRVQQLQQELRDAKNSQTASDSNS